MAFYIIQYHKCKTRERVTVRPHPALRTLKEAKLAANKIARETPIMDAKVIELKEVKYPPMIGYPESGSVRKPVCGKAYRTVEGDYNASGWYAL